MKSIIVFTLILSLVLIAGCTSTPSAPAAATPTPAPAVPQVSVKVPSMVQSGNYSITAAIDQIEPESKEPGKHMVNIYLRLTNTGNETIRLVCYSRLTDKNGLSHGGVGVSHGGSGAATFIFVPDMVRTVRDYVVVDSDKDYAVLKKSGATLDVSCADEKSPLEPISGLNSTWVLEPVYFT